MNKLLQAYLEFYIDAFCYVSPYDAGPKWTGERILGAALVALGIIVGTTVVTGLLLWWLIAAPVWFLSIVVLPAVTIYGSYRVIKAAVKTLEEDDENVSG